MKIVVLVRHGAYDIINGQYLLNEEGCRQLARLGVKLVELVGDARVEIRTSSAPRATASAEILARLLNVSAKEHFELWSGSDGVGHDPHFQAMVLQIEQWQRTCDVLIIVTHMEFVNALPNMYANYMFKCAFPKVRIEKGQAGVIDCEARTITLLS